MTRIADPLLLETPCCRTKVMQRRFASVNTFGLASRWSDGYSCIFMVPDASLLGYCESCDSIYWQEDAVRLGIVPQSNEGRISNSRRRGWFSQAIARFLGKRPELSQAVSFDEELERWRVAELASRSANYIASPRPRDLLSAVQREQWEAPGREIYLRTWLWWVARHGQRGRLIDDSIPEGAINDNMAALLALHQASPAPDEVAMAAGELLRQFGQFDEAAARLEGMAERNAAAAAILAAVRKKETAVFVLERF